MNSVQISISARQVPFEKNNDLLKIVQKRKTIDESKGISANELEQLFASKNAGKDELAKRFNLKPETVAQLLKLYNSPKIIGEEKRAIWE